MTCLKCGGLMTRERVSDLFDPCVLWRCIQCGLMVDWLVLRNRQASKERGADMPKFQSEEHRRKWIDSVRRAKRAKQQPIGTVELPIPVEPVATVPEAGRATVRRVDVLAAIERSLEDLARERAALEQAKELLSR